jgi:hypothetical protein
MLVNVPLSSVRGEAVCGTDEDVIGILIGPNSTQLGSFGESNPLIAA